MSETIRVRIAVAVMPNGEWSAAGWGEPDNDPPDKEKIAIARDTLPDGETIYWVEAEIPLPVEKVIQGEVV